MDSGFISVSSVDSFFVLVQIQLIQAENDGDIFGLPLLLVGILIMHAQAGHYLAAAGVVSVMGGCDKRKSPGFQKSDNGLNSLRSP